MLSRHIENDSPADLLVRASHDHAWPAARKEHASCFNHHALSPIDMQETDDGFTIYLRVISNDGDRLVLTIQDHMVAIRNLDRAADDVGKHGLKDWYGGSSFNFLLPDTADCSTARIFRENDRITIRIDKR